VTLPGNDTAVLCSAGTGAAIASTPYLVPVTDAQCITGSGLNFTFQQVDDYAIELSVENGEGLVATYTSPTDVVTVISTGSTPLDTETAYIGPQSFALAF
jgi:hypothetical protein